MNVVVVGGGSTGGLEALSRVAAALPEDFAAPLIAVLHSGEGSSTPFASLLSSRTTLPVSYAQEGDEPRPGRIYLALPGSHLVVRQSCKLGFESGPPIRNGRPSVDRLFATAAEAFGKRTIGVVLSGADSDGTNGLKAVKARGGISVVQSPSDSLAPSMPSAALMNDSPDHITLIEELGPLLVHLAQTTVRQG